MRASPQVGLERAPQRCACGHEGALGVGGREHERRLVRQRRAYAEERLVGLCRLERDGRPHAQRADGLTETEARDLDHQHELGGNEEVRKVEGWIVPGPGDLDALARAANLKPHGRDKALVRRDALQGHGQRGATHRREEDGREGAGVPCLGHAERQEWISAHRLDDPRHRQVLRHGHAKALLPDKMRGDTRPPRDLIEVEPQIQHEQSPAPIQGDAGGHRRAGGHHLRRESRGGAFREWIGAFCE